MTFIATNFKEWFWYITGGPSISVLGGKCDTSNPKNLCEKVLFAECGCNGTCHCKETFVPDVSNSKCVCPEGKTLNSSGDHCVTGEN